MTKGTPSQGKHQGRVVHIKCRRCGRRAYHVRKKRCAACGYGQTATLSKAYSWKVKNLHRERIR